MSHSTSYLLIAAIVLFGLYRRVRRTVGMQRLAATSMWTRVAVYAVLCAVLVAGTLSRPTAMLADAVGAAAGAAIAIVALRYTVLEQRGDAWFYRTHTWIGLGLTAVFVVRLAYRVTEIQSLTASAGAAPHLAFGNYAADPLTAGVYFLLAAYYGVYYILLMQKTRQAGDPGQPATGSQG